MRVSKKARILAELLERGFDQSTPSTAGGVRVRCSQCEALVINGVACHERGCPNKPPVCRECGQIGHFDCVSDYEDAIEDGQAWWAETGSTLKSRRV